MKTPFTHAERQSLVERFRFYGIRIPDRVNFYWTKFWFADTCGMFKIPNCIYLNINSRDVLRDRILDDVIAHELIHFRQYEDQGAIFYALNNLTKLNEKEAYAEQERVRKIIEG